MKQIRFLPLLAIPLALVTASCGLLEDDPATAVEAALENNDFAAARISLAKLLGEQPDNSDLRLQYAEVLLQLGDPLGAQTALEALPADMRGSGKPAAMMAHALLAQEKGVDALSWAAQADQSDPYTAWVRIGALLLSGEEGQAYSAADEAVAAHPEDARLLALRGEMALSRREIERAKRFAAQAVAADAKDFTANTLAGKVALLGEDFEAAEKYFAAAVAANRSTPGPYLSLGAVQADLGKFDAASETLAMAQSIAPDHPMAMFLSAKLAFVKGELDEAHAIMQEAESSLRRVPAAQLLQGEIAHLRGNHEQAIAFLRPFLRDDPAHVHGATVMAQALLATGDAEKAWQVIEKPAGRAVASGQLLALASKLAQQTGREDSYAKRLGAKAAPEDAGKRLALADKAIRDRNWAKARDIYAALRKEGLDSNVLVLNNGALAELNTGNGVEALALARRAAALTPDDPAVMDTVGWVLLQAGGDKAEALRWIGKAKDAMPGNLEFRWHYAAALAANGRKNEARAEIAKVRQFADAAQREHIDRLMAQL